MDSSVGRNRLIFASDAPLIAPSRALDEAKRLPISELALRGFLGANALEALGARAEPIIAARAA
jgi:predicted TIM-barrel fold metal-dependent hydrolase